MHDPHAVRRTYDTSRFVAAEEASVNGGALDKDRKMAAALGWGQVVGVSSTHRCMCVSEWVGERCKISQAVAANWSMSGSVVVKALDDSNSSRASGSGRGSWTETVSGGCDDGDRWSEKGIGDSRRTGVRKDSGSACFVRRCRSSSKCGSEWPCIGRRPRESSRIQSCRLQ